MDGNIMQFKYINLKFMPKCFFILSFYMSFRLSSSLNVQFLAKISC